MLRRVNLVLFVLVASSSLGAAACGDSSPPRTPVGGQRPGDQHPGADPRASDTHRDLALVTATPTEQARALGAALGTACGPQAFGDACAVAVARALRDRLRGRPGSADVVALLDAIANRRSPGGPLAEARARERARARGGEAASLAAFYDLVDAEATFGGARGAGMWGAARILAQELPSRCPEIAIASRRSSELDLRAAVSGPSAGACALACPEVRDILPRGDDRARAAMIARACGPEFFGLTSTDDALPFSDDADIILAVRGLQHVLEDVRLLRTATDPLGRIAARVALPRFMQTLRAVAIPGRVPATVQFGSTTIELPVVYSTQEEQSGVLVVLEPESVHVGAREWIGVSDTLTLARYGDPLPGVAVTPAAEPLDAAAIARALDDAVDRAWYSPAPAAGAAPAWLAVGPTDPEPRPAPALFPVGVQLVADADAPLATVGALVAALTSARPARASLPLQPLQPFVCIVVWQPPTDTDRAHTGCVEVAPRAISTRPPTVTVVMDAQSARIVAPGRPRVATRDAIARIVDDDSSDQRPVVRFSGDGASLQRVLDLVGPLVDRVTVEL